MLPLRRPARGCAGHRTFNLSIFRHCSIIFLLKEDYLTLSYNNIMNHYGTIETFLYEEYGITEDIRKEIQDYCLE